MKGDAIVGAMFFEIMYVLVEYKYFFVLWDFGLDVVINILVTAISEFLYCIISILC